MRGVGDGSYAEDDPLITFGFALPVRNHLVAIGEIPSSTMAIVALVRPLSRDQAQRNYSLRID